MVVAVGAAFDALENECAEEYGGSYPVFDVYLSVSVGCARPRAVLWLGVLAVGVAACGGIPALTWGRAYAGHGSIVDDLRGNGEQKGGGICGDTITA